MARTTFERKTRSQNTKEIASKRSSFTGEYSDLPANEIAPEACRGIVNACAFKESLEPREGMQQMTAFAIPGMTADFACTKSGTHVTLTGHVTSTANNGYYIVYANGSPSDVITGVVSSNTYNVSSSAAVAATTAHVRPPLYGMIYHRNRGYFLVHFDGKLYKVTTTGTWTQIYQAGADAMPALPSTIVELNQQALVFCNGLFKVNLDTGLYWKTNIDPATNTLVNQLYPQTGYCRRYLYTMSRQSGTAPLNTDRVNNTIEQETGANLLVSGTDYKEIYSVQIPAGPATTTYGVLTTGSVSSTIGLVGPNMYFDVMVDGTLYTISYSVGVASSLSTVAAAIQTVMQSLINTNCYCRYNPGTQKFTLANVSPNSTIGYMATPAVNPGYTDISATIKGTLVTGAALSSALYYYQPILPYYTPSSNYKAMTHYSFYQTRQLVRSGTAITGNPSAYAYMTDYPLMHCARVSFTDGTHVAVTGGNGSVLHFDNGNYITLIDSTGSHNAYQKNITSVTGGQWSVDSTIGSPNSAMWAFVGSVEGALVDSTAGSVQVQTFLETWNPSANYTPSTSAPSLAVGDPLFCDDGYVRYITAITDSTSFRVNDAAYSVSKGLAALTPKTVASGNYAQVIKDDVDDSVVSANIGTLGLKSRFYTAMPSTSIGAVSPGFVIIAASNKYYWNNIDIAQQYIIGNCHPAYQVEQLAGEITAACINQNMISFFCSNCTYSVQTNLNLTFTDVNNGNVIYILPKPIMTDMYIGVQSDVHLFNFERDLIVAVNQDYGLRTWSGTGWSDNLIFKKIQNKLKLLTSFLVCYDVKYGVIVIGKTSGSTYYNKIYTIGIRKDKYLGCSEFNLLPFPDIDVQPVNYNTRMWYFPLGTTVGRWADGKLVTWLQDSFIDVPDSTVPATGYEIAWSWTTGDDVGTDQGNTLRHLESRLFVSGRGTNESVPSAVSIDTSIYNDVGTYVTINKTLKSQPYYNGAVEFDKRVEGHRIRYMFAVDKANLVVNGMTSYYTAYDKAPALVDRVPTESSYANTPVFGFTRIQGLYNLGDGRLFTSAGTVRRITGADGRTNSGVSTY